MRGHSSTTEVEITLTHTASHPTYSSHQPQHQNDTSHILHKHLRHHPTSSHWHKHEHTHTQHARHQSNTRARSKHGTRRYPSGGRCLGSNPKQRGPSPPEQAQMWTPQRPHGVQK